MKEIMNIGMNSETRYWNPMDLLNDENVQFAYAVLILNRPVSMNRDYLISVWNRAAVHVAVDGGANRWYKVTEKETTEKCALPDMITGDMDSIKPEIMAHYVAKNVEVIRTPDQDETDFTKALREIGAYTRRKEIKLDAVIAVVESSGRLDQTVANINTLFKAESILGGIPVFLLGKNSLTWRLGPGYHEISTPLSLLTSRKWCSLIPFGSPAIVTTTGLKWNLDNRELKFGKLVSTSNTYSGNPVVTVRTNESLIWSMAMSCLVSGEDDDDDDD